MAELDIKPLPGEDCYDAFREQVASGNYRSAFGTFVRSPGVVFLYHQREGEEAARDLFSGMKDACGAVPHYVLQRTLEHYAKKDEKRKKASIERLKASRKAIAIQSRLESRVSSDVLKMRFD